MSGKRCGTAGWLGCQGLLLAMVQIALLSTLSGCGSGQTDVGQINGNNVPVNLNISMPQESATASTSGSRFWATVQSWLPSVTNAWAVTYDLSELTVSVTDSDQQLLATTTKIISSSHDSGESISIDLDVPVGSDRIFAVSGLDRTSRSPILQGKSTPVTLTAGQAATVAITLNAVDQPLLVITTASPLPTGTVNQPYPVTTLTATGGTPPLTWDPVVIPPLPNGLMFNPGTATISGTPLRSSGQAHRFTVRDSTAPSNQTGTKELRLVINSALTIDTTSLPSGTVGVPYDVQLGASGGTPPYTWSIVGNDPAPAPSLTLNSAGRITGTPSTAQGSPFTRTYRVTDQAGVTRDSALTIIIGQQLVISAPASLPNGVVGTPYSVNLTAAGGTPPYSWTVTPLLPAGLALTSSGSTATIGGTPTARTTTSHTFSVTDSSSPTPRTGTRNYSLTVVGPVVSVTAMSASSFAHSLALTNDARVWAWGNDRSGQLGNDTPLQDQPTPVRVSGLTGVIVVSAGSGHSLALRGDGTVWAWGDDAFGQLGNDAPLLDQPTPVPVNGLTGTFGLPGVIAVSAGRNHSLAATNNGKVWAWGQDVSGQLGNDTPLQNQPTPVQVELSGVIAVSAGGLHSLALRGDGTVWAWGNDQSGQLGNDAPLQSQAAPVPVDTTNLR
mgnify:FL=1